MNQQALQARTRPHLVVLVGCSAVAFSGLSFVSDVLELAQDGLSRTQLVLTYVTEAALPIFVIGLYILQRPHIARLGILGALSYVYAAYVFLIATLLLTVVERPPTWTARTAELAPWVRLSELTMALAGVAFGVAVVRARVLPQWTGFLLLGGVLLLAAGSAQPGPAQVVCAGMRDLAFGGMGLSLLTGTAHLHSGLWSLPPQAGGTGAEPPPGGLLGPPRGDVARS